jgi:hypothetical protein
MKVIHIDQDITLVAGGAFFEPKVQTPGSAVTFWGGHRLASLFNLITTRQRTQAGAADRVYFNLVENLNHERAKVDKKVRKNYRRC